MFWFHIAHRSFVVHASFAISMGLVGWVILAEMFSNHIRSTAIPIVVAGHSGRPIYVAKQSFPVVLQRDTDQGNFWNGSQPYFMFTFFIEHYFLLHEVYPWGQGQILEEIRGCVGYSRRGDVRVRQVQSDFSIVDSEKSVPKLLGNIAAFQIF